MNISHCRAHLLSSCYSCPSIINHGPLITSLRRGGRAVDCAGLENRKAERAREFESHPLRSCFAPVALRRIGKIARSRMPSEALAKEGGPLYYVYLIESLSVHGQRYVG